MRFLVKLLLVAIVFPIPAMSAGFSDIHSPNGVDVWAVGPAGSVFHSLDAGLTWGATSLGSSDLSGVFTIDNDIWIVGQNGQYFLSTDGGNNWSSATLGGGVWLRSVYFSDNANGWVIGNQGTILHTTDGGITWSAQSSGTNADLYAIAFVNPTKVFVVGAGATVLSSDNGGESWVLLPGLGSGADLYTVGGSGTSVTIAGQDGFHRRSDDGGLTWSGQDLVTDTRSDVFDLHVLSPDTAFYVGGGGYIRKTMDGAGTFSWAIHPLLATVSRIFFYDGLLGWACAGANDCVIRTTDGGTTWAYPPNTSVTSSWSQRLNATSSIGNTLAVNGKNKNHIYAALGRFVYMSGDRGETWSQTATISGASGSTHSFYVSPRDTNFWVAAYTGGGDHIRRSTDRGVTWTSTIARGFTSYGMPLEMNPDHPDTLLFAADAVGDDGVVYRSLDFGLTWDTLAVGSLRSPCDIVIVPDSNEIVYIGDGITGSGSGEMWRSINFGKSYTLIYSVSGSEIPTISVSRLRNSEGYATAWGSGGVMRTQNLGLDWEQIETTGSTWGTDVAKDDPNVVVYGSYGSGDAFISTDAGESFVAIGASGSNYGYLAYDRATMFAQQSGGVWKLTTSYTMPTTNVEAMVLLSPNGGEEWEVGEEEEIRWTSSNVSVVDIEYSVDDGQNWMVLAEDVSAGDGSYGWVIPNTATEEGLVRVSDGSDATPSDVSDGSFSIVVSAVSVSPETLSFGGVVLGNRVMDTVRVTNQGTTVLVVTSVETGNSVFVPGRTSFTIGVGESDTLSVWFEPMAVGEYLDTLVITTDAPGGIEEVVLTGSGEPLTSVEDGESLPRSYVLEQNYPNPFNPETEIRYGIPNGGHVVIRVYTMLGEEVTTLVDEYQGAGWHSVVFGGEDLSSGLYLYRLETPQFVSSKKMILLK